MSVAMRADPQAALPRQPALGVGMVLPPTSLTGASGPQADWPALSRGFEMLATLNPTAADALREATIPRASTRLGPALMGMLAALRKGDIGAWLGGKAMEALGRQGGGAVARQLASDFASLRHTARDSAGEEWRGYTLPLENQGSITPVHFHVRAPQQDADEEDANTRPEDRQKGVRFLIDLHLTQLGPLQLEGLARSGDRRLDVVMRARDGLPAEIRDDIRRIYSMALEATGQSGGLIFQSGEQGWLRLARQRSGQPLGLDA